MQVIADTGVHVTLAHYSAVAHLAAAVDKLRAAAAELVPRLRGRTVWMVNSTAQGGGVAELLPAQITLLRDLGLDVRWAVIETDKAEFFALTKRLHNLIHDSDAPHPTAKDRELYDAVNRDNAAALGELLQPHDILVVHDPQPAGLGALLKRERGTRTVWRSHIGVEQDTANTRAAWEFLRPYAEAYDEVVFTLPDYAPGYLRQRAVTIHPTIDPLGHKNRELSLHKMVGILCDARLVVPHWPLLDPPFEEGAQRLQPDGSFAAATMPDDIGLLARPIVTQVSRWDRLKGFAPLLDAFRLLKSGAVDLPLRDDRHGRRLAEVRLVLAGPDPSAIQDDPEGLEVLDHLRERWLALDSRVQRDVALVTLPMASRKHNALMVNALQRSSDIVVQNSLREGFGLTVSEAMWKRTPVLGPARAAGVRLQVRDGVDGRLVDDPEDVQTLAAALHDMLSDSDRLDTWGHSAQRRVHDEFLMLGELVSWLNLLAGER